MKRTRSLLRSCKLRQLFSLTHPYYLSRSSLHKYISLHAASLNSPLLDVGCGSMPYRDLFTQIIDYHGLEISQRHSDFQNYATFWCDGKVIPLSNSTYQSVLCSQVLEHSANSSLTLLEINRILVVGGHLLLTMPFIWPEHEKPFDFQRFTSFGIKSHLNDAGFNIIEINKSCIGVVCLLQLHIEFLESLIRVLSPKDFHTTLRNMLRPYYLIVNLLGRASVFLSRMLRLISADELYLDLVVLAVKQ